MPILMLRETLISYDFRYEHYEVPSTVRNIADRCFNERWELEWLGLPEDLDSIGNLAFRKCISLRRIDMPIRVESLGTSLFDGCSSLRSVVMPEGTKEIDVDMFNGCSELREISLPCTVERIHRKAFSTCPALTTLRAPKELFELIPDTVKTTALLTYLEQGDPCTESMNQYFRENESHIVMQGIERNAVKAIHTMADKSMFTAAKITDYLEYANERKRTEIAAIILESKGSEASADAFDWDPFEDLF